MAVRLKSSVMSAGNLLVSQLGLKVVGPLVSLLVVRYLGPENYGYYASAMAVTALIGILADFGANQAALKYGSKGEKDLAIAFRVCRAVSFALASLAFVITLIWFLLLDYDSITIQIGLLFSINYFIIAYRAPATAVLQTKYAYRRLALISICVSLAQWIATLVMLLLQTDVRLVAGVPVVAAGAVSMMAFFVATKSLLVRPVAQQVQWGTKQFLHDVWVFGLGGTFHQIYYQSSGALLSAMRTPLEVGFYNVPFRLLGLIYLIPTVVFNQVLYSKYFKLSSSNRDRYRRLYILTSKLMLAFGTIITFGLWTFGGIAIKVMFGEDFEPSIRYLESAAKPIFPYFMVS